MLGSLNNLEHYKVAATDGQIGSAVNFLFDDERWVVRYLVVKTKGIREGHQVLISPISIVDAQWTSKVITLALSKEKVQNSPDVDADQPVSRREEAIQNSYYNYPSYWGYTGGLWGMGPSPALLRTGNDWKDEPGASPGGSGDIHLRSAREVRGYQVVGSDGRIGHVKDFIVDIETWAVRYLVIDTGDWWINKEVAVSPEWASQIDWAARTVQVDHSRAQIRSSPVWPGPGAVNREYEALLFEHYGRPGYWAIRRDSDAALRAIPGKQPRA